MTRSIRHRFPEGGPTIKVDRLYCPIRIAIGKAHYTLLEGIYESCHDDNK
jgi:hypothetical protein